MTRKMFSKRLLKLISLLATFSRFFVASQLCLDPNARMYFNTGDKNVQRRFKRNVYITLPISVVLATITLVLKRKDSDTVDFNICLILWYLLLLLSTVFLMWYLYSADMAATSNGMLQYASQLKGKLFPGYDAETDRLSRTLEILSVLCWCAALSGYPLLIACFAFCPTGFLFLHLVTPLADDIFLVRIVAYVVHIYIVSVLVHSAALSLVLITIYLFYMTNFFTKELRIGCRKYRTLDDLRKAQNVCCVYREFQVLHTNVINMCGPLLLFAHCIFIVVPVYGTILVLSSRGKANSFVLTLLSLVFVGMWAVWMMTLEFGKYLCVQGQEVFVSWRRHTWESKEKARFTSKFRKSCRPLLLGYHETFVVKRITPFVYIKGAVRGIFRTLLTLTNNL